MAAMVLCFLTGQKARKVPEKGSLSRVADQAVDALAMAVLDLLVLGDLDWMVRCHSEAPNLAVAVRVTQQSLDRRGLFARRSISNVALVRRKERLPYYAGPTRLNADHCATTRA